MVCHFAGLYQENLEVDHDECHLRLGLSENMMSVIVLSDTDVEDDRTCPPRIQITSAHSSNNNIYRIQGSLPAILTFRYQAHT
uniref:Uncharacterized protein n=1 Tax=Aegilops tauschii subsp. strangulata TaxID=200361 RepID=A0A453HNE5_AEGTS